MDFYLLSVKIQLHSELIEVVLIGGVGGGGVGGGGESTMKLPFSE